MFVFSAFVPLSRTLFSLVQLSRRMVGVNHLVMLHIRGPVFLLNNVRGLFLVSFDSSVIRCAVVSDIQ